MRTSKRVLLLGECPNPRVVPAKDWHHVDAFLSLPNSSGEWLQRQLSCIRCLHRGWRFNLENAVTLDRTAPRLSSYDHVLALSRRVARWFDLPYIPHPQYWKRFHFGEPEAWREKLLQLLEEHNDR